MTSSALEAAAPIALEKTVGPAEVIERPRSDKSSADAPVLGESPRLARNFAALLGGQFVTWTMTLLWTLIVPRLLGPDGLGIVNTALAIGSVLLIFAALGSSNYLTREIVNDPESAPQLIGTALVLKVVLSPVIFAAGVLFATLAHYSAEERIAIYLVAFGNIAGLFNDVQLGGFQAFERLEYAALGGVINKVGQSLVGIALAVIGLGAIAIVTNITVLGFVMVAVQLLWLRRCVHIDLRTNARLLGAMVKKSLPYWTIGLAFGFYLQIDTILLSLMTHTKVVGWYTAATTLVYTFSVLPNTAASTWLARFVAAFRHGPQRLIEVARTPVELMLVLSIPITAGIVMAAPTIIHVLYGSSYGPAAATMAILAFCVPPFFFNTVMTYVFLGSGRQTIVTAIMIGAAVINTIANVIVIPLAQSRFHNGAIGAAVALDVTELLECLATWLLLGRQICDGRVMGRCAKVTAASAAMWGVAYLARPLGPPISLASGVFALLLMAVLLRILTADEVVFLRKLLTRVRASGSGRVDWLRFKRSRPSGS